MSRAHTQAAVAVALLLLTLPLAGAAAAARKPTATEVTAIRFALAHDARTCCARPESRVTGIVVSTADPQFSTAEVQRLDKSGRVLGVTDALLWRGTKRWAVIDAGSDAIGCGFVSAKVRRDLFGTALCP